jgi:GT2 family glycosyltransferase
MSRLSIVIPVYDGWNTLSKCLEALVNSSWQDFEVLVVDHGTEDVDRPDTLPFADRLTLQLIPASPDLWWTGATNVGIRAALQNNNAQYIMLLNHDCYLAADALSILMELTESNADTLIAPVQVDAESHKVLVRKAYTLYLLGFPTVIPPVLFSPDPASPIESTGMIVGGRGVVIPKKVFSTIGLLDETHLPHYGSDNDFYLRCRVAGYRLSTAALARVYVDSSQTTEASSIGRLTLPRFLATFTERRSHRNVSDQAQLFRKHYPIRRLYWIGVALNLVRYTLIYSILRIVFLTGRIFR